MITNFEKITENLNPNDLKYLGLVRVTLEKELIGKFKKDVEVVEILNNAISEVSNPFNYRMTSVKLRKFVNHLRSTGMLPIIGTSKGYKVTFNQDEIRANIQGLNERSNSILAAANGLKSFLK